MSYLTDELSGVGGSVELETWQTGGGYNLGSGVDIGLDLQMTNQDLGAAGDLDSQSAGLVLSVSF